MEETLQNKLQKIYALINNGATEGERKAAMEALNRLVKKYSIKETDLDSIGLKQHSFSYKTELDCQIFIQIIKVFLSVEVAKNGLSKSVYPKRKIHVTLQYEDYITVECAYEYFRKHAAQQFKIHAHPILKKCRTTKSKNNKRALLLQAFIISYLLKSNLYVEGDFKEVDKINAKDYAARRLMDNVESGNYNKQVITNNLLN